MNNNAFFNNYRGRYSQYWVKRFGLIPELPTHFDNANSIYELLAWLQRGFKQLMDDFANLEMEFGDFQDAIKELLERLIPELIRNFAHSKEFRDLMKEIIKDVMEDPDMKDWFTKYLEEIMKRPDFKDYFKDYLKETIKEMMDDPEFKKIIDELLKNSDYLKDLIDGLKDELDKLSKMLQQSVQPSFSTLKGRLSDKFELTDPEHATWGLGYSIQDYKQGDKTTTVINLRPHASYIRLKQGQTLNDNEPIVYISRQELNTIGLDDEFLKGVSEYHILFRDGYINDENIRFSAEFKQMEGNPNTFALIIGGISYPAKFPVQGGHVYSGLDPFKNYVIERKN